MLETILELSDVSAGYQEKIILEKISFIVKRNETLAITGQNGSGKSTLLKTIARIISDNSGTITFKEEKIDKLPTYKLREKGLSYFVQGGLVFSSLTVKEHFDLVLKGKSKVKKKELLEECYKQFPDLIKLDNLLGGNLSGGQRQMLSFAMLISQETDVWLLDEPTAGLATKIVDQVIGFLKRMKSKKTIVIVEHNAKVVSDLATRTIDIDKFKKENNENKTLTNSDNSFFSFLLQRE